MRGALARLGQHRVGDRSEKSESDQFRQFVAILTGNLYAPKQVPTERDDRLSEVTRQPIKQ
jgi:hypothetical protein